MKPRIFISSTFYDLKYIREDISNFVKSHDFEPIMFEDGDIGYTPGKSLDKSCYETMRSADMVLLIIGGNYGSPSSVEKNENNKENTDFSEYTSVTRKEFNTAIEAGIPVFVFIEASVYSEFDVYELNKENIRNMSGKFVFSATKNINVFSFISEIKSLGNISITEFRRPSEIKDFLRKQWSDMFKNYLKSLKENKEDSKTHDSIEDLQTSIQEITLLLNTLFEKTFNTQSEIKYDSVKSKQRFIKTEYIARNIEKSIDFIVDGKDEMKAFQQIKLFIDYIVEISQHREAYDIDYFKIDAKATELAIRVHRIKDSLLDNSYMYELYHDKELRKSVIDIIAKNKIDKLKME